MKKWIIIVIAIVAGLAILLFVAHKVAEHIIKAQIEKQIEGSGVDVDLGRVAVNLLNRSVTLHRTHLKVQHDDASTPAKGIVALDAVIDRARVRGVSYKNKQLGAKSITLDTHNATMVLGSKTGDPTLMEMGAMRVDVDQLKTAAIAIDSLTVAFGTGESDRNRISLHTLTLNGINVDSLMAKKLIVDSITVDSTAIVSRKNRKIYEAPRVKPLLWQSVQRIPIAVEIKKIIYNDLDITYNELAAEATTDGVVSITNGHGTVTNLTNTAQGHDRFFEIDLTALLMHTGELTAHCRFPIDSLDNHWEMSGQIGKSALSAFNRAVEPLMNVKITDGEMQRLDYKIEGTNTQSHVWLTMRYSDLEVELLKKETHQKRGFLTFALNDILIRNSNPGRDGKGNLRTGEGTQQRDPQKSTYNFIWKSLIPGIKQTVL